MKKSPLFLLTLLALFSCSKSKEVQHPPTVVSASQAVTMDIPIFYDYIGHGDANSLVDIYAQVSGRLTTQKFTSGELVHSGDVLFTIDSRTYIAELKKAESDLEKNLASMRFAKEKAQSYTELIKDDIVSQLDFDQALTDVLTIEAQIEQSKASIEIAKINIQWCTVRSPITGVPSISGLFVGSYVPIGGNTPLVTIRQSVPLSLNIYVPESHYLKIRTLKSQGPIRVQAFSDQDKERVYEGALNLIDNTMDPETGTIWMQATFPNEDATMWPSEYFIARIYLGTAHNAVVIPEEAVVKTQKGNQVYVIKPDNIIESRLVTLGDSYRNLIIIEKGISSGEIVVLKGQINLYPGIKVVIKDNKLTTVREIEEQSPEVPEV